MDDKTLAIFNFLYYLMFTVCAVVSIFIAIEFNHAMTLWAPITIAVVSGTAAIISGWMCAISVSRI
jgi:hypothetical protein